MPQRSSLGGCSAKVHTPPHLPTTYEATLPTSEPPQPRLVSWHSFLPARLASIPSAADHCLVQRARECSVRLAPVASLNRCHLPCGCASGVHSYQSFGVQDATPENIRHPGCA